MRNRMLEGLALSFVDTFSLAVVDGRQNINVYIK